MNDHLKWWRNFVCECLFKMRDDDIGIVRMPLVNVEVDGSVGDIMSKLSVSVA